MGRKQAKAEASTDTVPDQTNEVVTLRLDPRLVPAASDEERCRAVQKLQRENPDHANTIGAPLSSQTFSVPVRAVLAYVENGQSESSALPASLRYMRLLLMLLVGPSDLVSSYLEEDRFRSKKNYHPSLVSAFAQVINFNHGLKASNADQKRNGAMVAAVHKLCFTALGRPRTNFAWLRFRRKLDRLGMAIPMLVVFSAVRLLTMLVEYLQAA